MRRLSDVKADWESNKMFTSPEVAPMSTALVMPPTTKNWLVNGMTTGTGTGGTNTLSAFTLLFAPVPGSNVASSVPSAFNRAKRFRDTPLRVVNAPASITRPLPRSPTLKTGPFAPNPLLKFTSSVPSTFSRVMPFFVSPANVVKAPPTTIDPLVCTTTE